MIFGKPSRKGGRKESRVARKANAPESQKFLDHIRKHAVSLPFPLQGFHPGMHPETKAGVN